MTVLITGAAGLVGAALVRAGGVGRVRADLDITDADAVAATLDALQPDAVVNAAALAKVDAVDSQWERAQAVNGTAPGQLALACRDRGIRCVHLSTDYVLTAPGTAPLTEDAIPDPRSAYARSKLLGEQRALAAGAVVVRIQWVYHPGHASFFHTALGRLRDGAPLSLVADQVGIPTPADWLASGLMACAAGGPAGVFHLAPGGQATAWAWIAAAADHLGLPMDSAQPTTRKALGGAWRPACSRLDAARFSRTWRVALPDWRDALRDSLDAAPPGWLSRT